MKKYELAGKTNIFWTSYR